MNFFGNPGLHLAFIVFVPSFQYVAAAPEHHQLLFSKPSGHGKKFSHSDAAAPGISQIAALQVIGHRSKFRGPARLIVAEFPTFGSKEIRELARKECQTVNKYTNRILIFARGQSYGLSKSNQVEWFIERCTEACLK